MKYILEFKEYNLRNKLNEGGGAGKEFTFDDMSYDLQFEYTKSGIKLISKNIELGEKMDIIGYQDGMRNISTEGMFETDIEYTLKEEQVGAITVAQIVYYVGEGELFTEYDKETTLKEIVKKEGKIDIQIGGSGELEYMYGAGWLTPHIEKGDVITIDTDNIRGDWSFGDSIDGKNVNGLFAGNPFGKQYKESLFSSNIKLTPTEKFAEFWKAVFIDTPSYQDYLDSFKEGEDEEPLSEEDFYEQHQEDLQIEYGI